MRQGRVTLADVAAATGLSTATVSLALRDAPRSRIPPATVARVRAAADELGYVTHHAAASLRTGRTGTLGFVSDEVTLTRFAAPMVAGLLDAAEAREHAVMIMETGRRADRLARSLTVMHARGLDAIAVGLMDSRRIELPPARGREPRLVVNGTAAGCHGILPDGPAAARAAVAYLVERGHRRIALVGRHPTPPAPEVSVTIGERMAGIDAGMADAGLGFAAEWRGDVWEPELGRAGVEHVLAAAPDVTAILAANDRIAFGVYQALGERGRRIPDDVSVLSFDDELLAGLVRPGLTTFRLPYAAMGELAADLLLDALDGAELPRGGTSLVPLELVERASVARL